MGHGDHLAGRAPWWFRKLVEAETAEYARRRAEDPGYAHKPTTGPYAVNVMYPGDELTLVQKLEKYGIVREPGDERKSAVFAAQRIPSLPVPKLGSFIRDPEESSTDMEIDEEFGA